MCSFSSVKNGGFSLLYFWPFADERLKIACAIFDCILMGTSKSKQLSVLTLVWAGLLQYFFHFLKISLVFWRDKLVIWNDMIGKPNNLALFHNLFNFICDLVPMYRQLSFNWPYTWKHRLLDLFICTLDYYSRISCLFVHFMFSAIKNNNNIVIG